MKKNKIMLPSFSNLSNKQKRLYKIGLSIRIIGFLFTLPRIAKWDFVETRWWSIFSLSVIISLVLIFVVFLAKKLITLWKAPIPDPNSPNIEEKDSLDMD